jgi:hypothetical protein
MSTAVSPNNGKDFLPWIFFFLGIATRVPFTSRLLLNMDSCQFALALEKFDITVHQPHPPGYFLYIMLGRMLNLFIADPNAVFVSISVFSSGLTVAGIYHLGKEMFVRKIGVVAALLALSSPSIWFHGEVSLIYIVEACFSTFIALFCWRILNGKETYLWISVIALGVAGGFRQDIPVFLFPVWLFSVRNLPPRKIVVSLGLLVAICLLWFIPMVRMTGGWDAYRDSFRELWLFNTGGHGVLEGEWGFLRLFSLKMFLFLIYGLGAGLFPLALAVYSVARRGQRGSVDSTKALFFFFWILPVMAFYLFVFLSVQNPGYILIFLPALLILSSFSIFRIGDELQDRYGRKILLSIITAVVILNTAGFFLMDCSVSYRWIRTHDRNLSILLADTRTFDPEETAVFVNNLIYYSYRHFMVYLPEYRVYNVDVRTAATGDRRKTFGGVDGKTILQDVVPLHGDVTRFVTPIDVEDVKYGERKMYESAGLTVRDVTPTMFVASGPVGMLVHVYPELRISFERRGNGS